MKKGFTLVELLISLSIFLIILSFVMPFFISNLKIINESQLKIDLQEQAQKTLDILTSKCEGAQNIVSVTDASGTDQSNSINEVSLGQVIINAYGTNNTFMLQNGVLYLDGTKAAEDINSLKISPVPEDKAFNKCIGINIVVNLSEKGINNTINSVIYFRNHN